MTRRLRNVARLHLDSLSRRGLAAVAISVAVFIGCGATSSKPVAARRCHGRSTAVTGSPGTAIRRLRALGSASTPVGGAPLLSGFGAVWGPSSAGPPELSVPTGKPTIAVHMPIDDVAMTSSCVYGLSQVRSTLLEVDPVSLRVTRRWTVTRGSHSIIATGAAVYIAYDSGTTGIERVDLTSGAVTRANIHGASGMAADKAIAAGAGSVWEVDGTSRYRLDPARLSLSSTTSLVASDVWFGDGSLWAASENPHGGVERIDPHTRTLAALPTSSVASDGSAGIRELREQRKQPKGERRDSSMQVARLPCSSSRQPIS